YLEIHDAEAIRALKPHLGQRKGESAFEPGSGSTNTFELGSGQVEALKSLLPAGQQVVKPYVVRFSIGAFGHPVVMSTSDAAEFHDWEKSPTFAAFYQQHLNKSPVLYGSMMNKHYFIPGATKEQTNKFRTGGPFAVGGP
ncbi:MAG: hypothetical protein KC609_07275, partial [Myxococcales bacterium]|nr:hypothetical protein [Myxococcales bacterium]